MGKSCVILYHSGVGGTEYISKLYYEELQKKNLEKVRMFSVEDMPDNLHKYDFFVFACPTFGLDMSKTMKIFINKLNAFPEDKYAMLVTTCGVDYGNTLYNMAEMLKDKNIITLNAEKYIAPSTDGVMSMPNKKSLQRFGKNTKAKVLQNINEFIINYQKHNDYKVKKGFMHPISPLFKNFETKEKHIYINQELCIKCKKCWNNCPYKCYSLEKDKLKFDGKECEYCLRCVHRCPTKALSIKEGKTVKTQLNEEFYKNIEV